MLRSLVPSSDFFSLTGRWDVTPNGSILSSWSGARISFVYRGEILQIMTGHNTERKDRFNGGTPTVAVSLSKISDTRPSSTKTFDVDGAQIIDVHDERLIDDVGQAILVEVTLIDWASVLELKEIIISENDTIQRPSGMHALDVLVLGDSISCGWTDGSKEEYKMPLGCLSAFPNVLKESLLEDNMKISLSLVAYPGLTLVDRDEAPGMESKFFHMSPWARQEIEVKQRPSVVIIALGTNDDLLEVSEKIFYSATVRFVSRILSIMHPKTAIFLEPFQYFQYKDTAVSSRFDSQLDAAVSQLSNDHPNTHFHFLKVRQYMHKEHTMDGLHFTPAGHSVLGRSLKEQFKLIMGPPSSLL